MTSIYGYYVRQEDLIHGRPWYKHDGRSIWWTDEWILGPTSKKGGKIGSRYAKLDNDGRCLPKIPNQKWQLWDGSNWNDAGNKVKVRCGYKPKGINTIIFMHFKEQTVNFSFIFPLIFECGF